MNERYRFSSENESLGGLDLTEEEEGIITRLGITPDDFRKLLTDGPFAEGSYALLFDSPTADSDLVAKVWKNPRHDSRRAANENASLRLLRIRDFKNAPKIRGYLQPSTILFEEKIEGEVVEEFSNEQIDRLAVALADLHSIKLNAYGKPFMERKLGSRMDYLLDGVETLHKIVEPFSEQVEVTELIDRALDKVVIMANGSRDAFLATNFTLIHFDLNKNNILFSKNDGAPVIVDWEQASSGDNAMDVAKLFLKSDFDEDQKKEFISAYGRHSDGDDPYFEERLKVYELFVLVNSIIWRLGVLRDMPQQVASENEDQFYSRVKVNFDHEVGVLSNLLLE